MNNKKLTYILICVIIILAIIFIILKLPKKESEKISEYTPEEEITEKQSMQTQVTLYYNDVETDGILPEARLIDAKSLVENPYRTLVEMLIDGSKNDRVITNIPTGTVVNSAELNGDMVILDLSDEFVHEINLGEEEEKKIIKTIVSTLVELKEVNSVKILINGNEGCEFADGAVNFKEPFTKQS